MTNFAEKCDEYLNARTGKYEYRSIRYAAAANALEHMGLSNSHTVLDLGAGMTEFDYHLRVSKNWRGRYIPIDGGIDGTDIEDWKPPRTYDFVVALEILEHLHTPVRTIHKLQANTDVGIVVSVPNPRTVDVLGIDETHVASHINKSFLESFGFTVVEAMFYGGVFSRGEPDSLFAVWSRT